MILNDAVVGLQLDLCKNCGETLWKMIDQELTNSVKTP